MKLHRIHALFVLFVTGAAALAQGVPPTMNYQGYLTDLAGSPLPDGSYRFIFSLYTEEAGGVALWSEVHPAVAVGKGLFTVVLGRGNPANPLAAPFDRQYYLGIQVGTDPELLPRVRLASSAYSMRSRMAEGVIDGAVISSKIADDAVSSGKIADGAVGTAHMADGAVTAPKIANNVITEDHIVPPIVSSISGVANDGGNINLVAGANVTITPDDAANSITIAASPGGSGLTLPYSGSANSSDNAFAVANSGSGTAGLFQSNSGTVSTTTLEVFSNNTNLNSSALYAHATAGAAVNARSGGKAPAGYFQNSGTGNGVNILSANDGDGLFINNSSGYGIDVHNSSSSAGIFVDNGSAAPGIEIKHRGDGNAAYFHIDNSASTQNTLRATTNSGNPISGALEVSAAAGNALDARNNSAVAQTVVVSNSSTGGTAQAMLVSSSGVSSTVELRNINSSPNALLLEGWAGSTQMFRMYNSGNFYAGGGLYATHATLREELGSASTPPTGGYFTDNAVYAWAHVVSNGSLAGSFGCTANKTGTGTYAITYRRAMTGNDHAPMAIAYEVSSPQFAVIAGATANGCTVKIWKYNTSTNTFSLADSNFYFHLCGRP